MVVRHGGGVVADLPVAPVSGASPVYERPYEVPAPPARSDATDPPVPVRDALLRLLGSPDLASKRWIWEQYDHTVMADTVQRPGGDAAVVRVHGTAQGPGAHDRLHAPLLRGRPRHRRPAGGGRGLAQPRRHRRHAARHHRLPELRQPRAPGRHGPDRRLHRGHGRGLPRARLPGRLGQRLALQRDQRRRASCPRPRSAASAYPRPRPRWPASPSRPGDLSLVLIGDTAGWLDRSLYRAVLHGREDGPPPPVDLGVERRNGELVLRLIRDGVVRACHDLSDGGLLVALAEMCLAGRIGATLLPPPEVADRTAGSSARTRPATCWPWHPRTCAR